MAREWVAEESDRKAKKQAVKFLLIGFAVFVLVAIVLLLFAVDLSYKHFSYPEAAKRYKASGLPWTADELVPPEAGKSEKEYQALIELLEQYALKTEPKNPNIKDLITPSDYAALDAYFAPRNELLDKAQSVAGRTVTWQKDWDSGAAVLFPELASIKTVVKDLVLRAELRSARRDIKGAAADLRAGSDIAKNAIKAPTLIHGLVEIACRSILVHGLQRTASFHLNDPIALEELRMAAKPLAQTPDLYYSLKGEAFMGLTSLRNFNWRILTNSGWEEGMEPIDTTKLVRGGDIPGIAAKSFAVPYLNAWAEFAEKAKVQGSNPQSMIALSKTLEESAESQKGVSATFVSIFFPVFSQAGRAFAKTEADYLTADYAMRIAVAKAKGSTAKVTEADIDPFDGTALKVLINKSNIKVWSIGLNRTDEGGLSADEGRAKYQLTGAPGSNPPSREDFDLVFELPYKRYIK